MNFKDALQGRRSVRRYRPEQICSETVRSLLEAAQEAPSAGNLSARRYVVVTNAETQKFLCLASYAQKHVETAPLLIVVCADVERSKARYGDRGSLYAIQDADAATMCLLLAAYDRGLGACWTGAFDDALVREALNLEDGIMPVAIITLGWPAETPAPAPKRNAEEITRWIE
jgi:nitroreductase